MTKSASHSGEGGDPWVTHTPGAWTNLQIRGGNGPWGTLIENEKGMVACVKRKGSIS